MKKGTKKEKKNQAARIEHLLTLARFHPQTTSHDTSLIETSDDWEFN